MAPVQSWYWFFLTNNTNISAWIGYNLIFSWHWCVAMPTNWFCRGFKSGTKQGHVCKSSDYLVYSCCCCCFSSVLVLAPRLTTLDNALGADWLIVAVLSAHRIIFSRYEGQLFHIMMPDESVHSVEWTDSKVWTQVTETYYMIIHPTIVEIFHLKP